MGAMLLDAVDLSPNAFDAENVLVNGFTPDASTWDRRRVVRHLLATCRRQSKESLTVNSTTRADEQLLNQLGFDIFEGYNQAGLTTAVFEFDTDC